MFSVLGYLYEGMKSGGLWYLRLSLIMELLSYGLYLMVSRFGYESVEKQNRDVLFAGRMLLASIAAVVISLITALGLSVMAGVVLGVVSMLLIVNIERLPIWKE